MLLSGLQNWLAAQFQILIIYGLLNFGLLNFGLLNFGTSDASSLFSYLLVKKSQLNLVTYWAIVTVVYAWSYYRRQTERESELKIQLAEAQLSSLRMQLQPHFLFNSLHSVSALLYEDARAADRMIARSSDLLRLTLADGKHQDIRLEKRVADFMQVSGNRTNPQPLVENAVRHGIEIHPGIGRIEIEVQIRKENLLLRVLNNGQFVMKKNEGVGLSNTRVRLERLDDRNFSLELRNLDSFEVEAVIILPLKFETAELEAEEIRCALVAFGTHQL